jgi:hypothetical protein
MKHNIKYFSFRVTAAAAETFLVELLSLYHRAFMYVLLLLLLVMLLYALFPPLLLLPSADGC